MPPLKTTHPYPKRPKFFAIKVCRLLANRTVANEIGAQACWLLTVIAMAEDVRRYTDAVTFYNEQLLRLVGAGSVDALDRVRRKAVRAGWLSYVPGGKGVPGRYFVTVPQRYRNTDDAPSDENEIDDGGGNLRENAEGSAEGTAREVRKEPREKCGTLLPTPSPTLTSAAEAAGERAPRRTPETNTKKRAAPKEKKPGEWKPLFDAIAEVTGSSPVAAGSHIGKVASVLASEIPPYTPEEVREFGQRFWEFCPWAARHQRARPELGELQKHISKLRAAALDMETSQLRIKTAANNPMLQPTALHAIYAQMEVPNGHPH